MTIVWRNPFPPIREWHPVTRIPPLFVDIHLYQTETIEGYWIVYCGKAA